MALAGLAIMIIIGGLKLILSFLFLILFSFIGVHLYEIKTKTWLGLLILKIPLNVMFNPFFLIMLLKSWTMLSFEDELADLENKINEH